MGSTQCCCTFREKIVKMETNLPVCQEQNFVSQQILEKVSATEYSSRNFGHRTWVSIITFSMNFSRIFISGLQILYSKKNSKNI